MGLEEISSYKHTQSSTAQGCPVCCGKQAGWRAPWGATKGHVLHQLMLLRASTFTVLMELLDLLSSLGGCGTNQPVFI